MVQMIAGGGDVRMFPETDHLMAEAADEIFTLSRDWVTDRFTDHAASPPT